MVLGGYPVSYLLLCGQAALLLGNLLLLHCVSRSHSHNATAEPELTSAGAAHPEGSPGAASWEYGDPHSPVILCSYLSATLSSRRVEMKMGSLGYTGVVRGDGRR